MIIKILFSLLTAVLIANQVTAEELKKTSNARAYRAHLMTFIWPEKSSNEKIDYANIYDLADIKRFSDKQQNQQSDANVGFSFGIGIGEPKTVNPFDRYQEKLSKEITILSNQMWPMIFEEQGSTVEKRFYSGESLDGYPVLLGDIQIKLGRYLETEINYQHYLFDSFSVPSIFGTESSTSNQTHLLSIPMLSNAVTSFSNIEENNNTFSKIPTVDLYQPASVLAIKLEHKTASKKLNYLDHPIIGSLLYFEPISLEDAEQEIMLDQIRKENILFEK